MSPAAPPPLVLGSASPRRRSLLKLLDLPHEVRSSGIDESRIEAESPVHFVRRAARDKCLDVAAGEPGAMVIGADTVVCFETDPPAGAPDLLGKPRDRDEARRMLGWLSGRRHQVLTGLALHDPRDSETRVLHERSHVLFRPLTPGEIEAYLDSPEPWDKAGSYALQGEGCRFIEAVEGDVMNVVGLPLAALVALLQPNYPALRLPSREALALWLGEAARLLPPPVAESGHA